MDAEWDACDTADGFVVHGAEKMRFAELAAEAATLKPPAPITLRKVGAGGMSGKPVARIDLPSKVDGSARFAADVRLPDMLFASIRNAPGGTGKPIAMNRSAAIQQPGVVGVHQGEGWAAVVASTWWAADRGADRLAPRFEGGAAVDSRSIAHVLDDALANGQSKRFVEEGDADGLLRAADTVKAEYAVGLAPHAPIETLTATARFTGDRLEIWMPTQAPAFARSAVARAVDIDEDRITLYPMLIGGSFGRNVTSEAAEVAAILARETKRPVQLIWSRSEDIMHDRFRPPAKARLAAKLGSNGSVLGWRAAIATPSTNAQLLARLMPKLPSGASKPERGAVEGALPSYSIPAVAIDHHVAEIGLPTGSWRSVAHSYTAFFNECFIDELAHKVGAEPLSFRMQMLGNAPRLARCLATVTALGNWQGGEAGSAQGIAAHSCFGSHVAILAEARGADGRIKVDRIVAAVDCGRVINPDIVRQQIEGGVVFGLAAALGHPIPVSGGHGGARSFDELGLPRLADTPEIQVEILPSEDEPGGVGEIAVPPVAPAIANALFAASGQRLRSLPLALGSV
jgi:isoquinoline 1-oxidoreductase beta subunit